MNVDSKHFHIDGMSYNIVATPSTVCMQYTVYRNSRYTISNNLSYFYSQVEWKN